jgi:hypothetical protein
MRALEQRFFGARSIEPCPMTLPLLLALVVKLQYAVSAHSIQLD